MLRILPYLTSLLLSLAAFAANTAGDTRAADLLKQARSALGGDARVSAVQSLTCTGTFHRSAGDRDVTGDITLAMQLPDKLLRTESVRPMPDATIVTEQGVNGDRLLRNARTIGGGPGMVVRFGAPPGPDAEAEAVTAARAELARFALAVLLVPPSDADVAYVGEAASDDGRADVIEAKGPGTFGARLFLDKTSHRPLMVSYRGVAPRMVMFNARQHGAPNADEEARHRAQEEQPHAAAPLADIALFFDDYRTVDGVMLPHHISRSVDGKPAEEWTFTTIRVNPVFKADAFSVK